MKLLIIILVFPFVAGAWKVEYKSATCEYKKADYMKAVSNQNKTYDFMKSSLMRNDGSDISETSSDVADDIDDLRKARSDLNYYNCLKKTPACIQSMDGMSKAYGVISKVSNDLRESYSNKVNSRYERAKAELKKSWGDLIGKSRAKRDYASFRYKRAREGMSKAKADYDNATADLIIAIDNAIKAESAFKKDCIK